MNSIQRKALNNRQLQVLYALYKFRFGTEELLAKQQKAGRRYMHERMRILCEQEYVAKRYDSTYRLLGKPATYHLTPKAVALLKQRPDDFRPQVLRNIRKDQTASNRFARHCINIFAVYCELKAKHGDNLKFFTRSYLSSPAFDFLPDPKPDAYLSISVDGAAKPRRYILECFDDTMPQSAMQKRINLLVNHADSGDWKRGDDPEILLVCGSEMLVRRARGWIKKALKDSWLDDLAMTPLTIEGLQEIG